MRTLDDLAVYPMLTSKDWLLEPAGDEIVAYNLGTDRAHCLSPVVVQVLKCCTGDRSGEEIAHQLDLPIDLDARRIVVGEILLRLKEIGLLEVEGLRVEKITRRQMIKTIGGGAIAAAALPLITTMIAPTPAHAASCVGVGGACTQTSQCCPGLGLICCGNNSSKNKNKCVLPADC